MESPFNKVAALKVAYFIKKEALAKVVFCEIFKNTYFEKQLQTAASVHSVSKLGK